jgi:hypothetical protein
VLAGAGGSFPRAGGGATAMAALAGGGASAMAALAGGGAAAMTALAGGGAAAMATLAGGGAAAMASEGMDRMRRRRGRAVEGKRSRAIRDLGLVAASVGWATHSS